MQVSLDFAVMDYIQGYIRLLSARVPPSVPPARVTTGKFALSAKFSEIDPGNYQGKQSVTWTRSNPELVTTF